MTSEETRNLELSKRYEELYNTDIPAFVSECYSEDCEVMGTIHGRQQLLRLEQRVHEAAPRRFMRVERRYVLGATVVVEALLLDPDRGEDWQLPFCAVLTCRDGQIVNDRTYAEFSKWPLAPKRRA